MTFVGPLPPPNLSHLVRMTDGLGLHEHARGRTPAHEFGYCVDDAARALVLATSVRASPAVLWLQQHYLAFVLGAAHPDGGCHNRLSPGGEWTDEPGVGDWWGRAIWATGTLAATGAPSPARDAAARAFALFTSTSSTHRRAMAYAALGAARLAAHDDGARSFLHAAVCRILPDGGAEPASCWPEPRLSYDNAVLPLSLLSASVPLGRSDWRATGLGWLRFLIARQMRRGHLSVVPSAGADIGEGGGPPCFDQQPVELANLAAAARLAHQLTGEPVFGPVPRLCAEWFLGKNDQGVPLYDLSDGSCADGLTAEGVNSNRGAESTIAANLTLFHAQGVR
ncbi:hypothetical protein [Propionicimonas sp.]|uniref:hypothetical protein n=1 Tax=Propionicimonas sp. TaxID=1955623 RepID=UPI0039E553B8